MHLNILSCIFQLQCLFHCRGTTPTKSNWLLLFSKINQEQPAEAFLISNNICTFSQHYITQLKSHDKVDLVWTDLAWIWSWPQAIMVRPHVSDLWVLFKMSSDEMNQEQIMNVLLWKLFSEHEAKKRFELQLYSYPDLTHRGAHRANALVFPLTPPLNHLVSGLFTWMTVGKLLWILK